jgi:hypothetical protein
MDLKDHILQALAEQLESWDKLISGMSDELLTMPLEPSPWRIKDLVAHLWAWQLRSNARLEAAIQEHAPHFPDWPAGLDPEAEDVDQINDWLYKKYRDLPRVEVYSNWKNGYQQLLGFARQVSEKDLLDSSKYPWMNGDPLVLVLLGTYDHHQEHLDKLQEWLREYSS